MEKVVLGIDPGYTATGFAVARTAQNRISLIDCGYVALPADKHLSERIGQFFTFFDKKITDHAINSLVLETPFLGKNAQTFLKLGYLRGVLYLLADKHHLAIQEFAPREVKQALTGFGGAQKDQVARVIATLFPQLPPQKKEDVTDAIAVTLCGIWRQ
ncbi:MAG: crossover junction endodeoxyribonuclease RuvC [Candidatus Babeliales bacterium]